MNLEVKEAEVEKIVKTKVKEKRFLLDLSEEEAFYIMALTGNIVYRHNHPTSMVTERIYNELAKYIKKSTFNVYNHITAGKMTYDNSPAS